MIDNTPQFIIKFADFLYKRILQIELIFLSLGIVALLLSSFNKVLGEVILILSLIPLGMTYYLFGLRITEPKFDKFHCRLTYYSYSVAVISTLFVLQMWKGGIFIHQLGLIAVVFSILSYLILGITLKKIRTIKQTEIIRTLIIFLVLSLLFLTSNYKELKTVAENENSIEITE